MLKSNFYFIASTKEVMFSPLPVGLLVISRIAQKPMSSSPGKLVERWEMGQERTHYILARICTKGADPGIIFLITLRLSQISQGIIDLKKIWHIKRTDVFEPFWCSSIKSLGMFNATECPFILINERHDTLWDLNLKSRVVHVCVWPMTFQRREWLRVCFAPVSGGSVPVR